MRKVLTLLLVFLTTASLTAAVKPATELRTLLKAMVEEVEIHPDSVIPNIQQLEARKKVATDPTERAITNALLGFLYDQHAWRASRYVSETESDSTNMKAWTRDDYQRAAAQRFSEALSDLDLLHLAKQKDWMPLLDAGKDDKQYGKDMLMVVWRAANNHSRRTEYPLPTRANIIEYYKGRIANHGETDCREGLLLLQLSGMGTSADDRATYLRWKDDYRDLKSCAEVYLRLSQCERNYLWRPGYDKDSMAVEWLKQGIKLYPGYKRIARLKEELQDLQSPSFSWRVNASKPTAAATAMPVRFPNNHSRENLLSTDHPYPGQTYDVVLSMQNVSTADFALFRLPENFDDKAFRKTKDDAKFLKKNATLIRQFRHVCTPHQPWEPFEDTLQWTMPEPGDYMMLMLPSTNAKLRDKTRPKICRFYVSRLMANYLEVSNKRRRVIVNDALTGAPQQGVNVEVFSCKKNRLSDKVDTTYYYHGKTDAKGQYEYDRPKDAKGLDITGIEVYVWRDGDRALPTSSRYYMGFHDGTKDDHGQSTHLYTDRSIYRPGQTVHVGGLVNGWKQWQEYCVSDEQFTIKLLDPNGKAVADTLVRSDAMGVFACDLTLPAKGVPGTYIIQAGNASRWIRMEEYKRPTFEVTCDETPDVRMPVDSITLTGHATNYNGAPVRSARVVGHYDWESGFWYRWMPHKAERYEAKTDTVLTDDKGQFSVTIPVPDYVRYGRMLVVKYDVTSPTGETHTAETSLYLSARPLSIFATVPRMVDRDQLKPWSLMLANSTGQEVKGDVKVTLRKPGSKTKKTADIGDAVPLQAGGDAQQSATGATTTDGQGDGIVFTTTLPSGASVMPDKLCQAPSGRYDVELQAIVNGDTVETTNYNVVFFSQNDTQVPVDTTLWFYVPQSTFSKDKSAKVQVGSSKDAWLYYTLTSNDELVADRLYHLQDSLMTITLPYEERFKQGLSLHVSLVRNGKWYHYDQTFLLEEPDRALRHKWVTFRDKLQPGQKETWQLQLSRPDGTPATANFMGTLYDASLDAILSNNWSYHHSLTHHVRDIGYQPLFNGSNLSATVRFLQKNFEASEWLYSTFDKYLFQQKPRRIKLSKARSGAIYDVAVGGAPYRVSAAASGSLMLNEVAMAVDEADYVAANETASPRVMKSVHVKSNSASATADTATAEETAGDANEPVVQLRENFNETAFFLPCLRTDANGTVTIEFTLPESLTTWRLLGLAHTQDMLSTLLDEKVVAQKDLMAQTLLPRFLRQGDQSYLSASVYNISEQGQSGRAVLTILDAQSEKVLHRAQYKFDIKAKSDSTFLIPFDVPEDGGMLIVRWAAEGTTCSDGEQHYLPVLSNKEWMTETRALTYLKPGQYTEDLASLFPVKSATNRRLTVEYTSQPAWYAIQALPSLAWPKHQDVLSLATAYFAGSIGRSIVEEHPRIRTAYSDWVTEDIQLNSKLLQNEDVKNIALEETPWVALAEQESTRKQRLASLFDEATQNSLQKTYLDKMRRLQHSDGSFSWYPGMYGNYYLTREVAYLLTRQLVMTGHTDQTMLQNAISFIRQDRPTYLGTSSLRYLYVLYNSQTTFDRKDKHNADSLLRILAKHPEDLSLENRALAAIVLKKAGRDKASEKYLASIKKYLVTNAEGLTYFEFPEGAFTSINRKLHIHVQVMEAIATLTPKDECLDGMRRYLLRHKRTSEWDTPINTANAVYALLLNNPALLSEVAQDELTLGKGRSATKLDMQTTSLGYTRQAVDIGQNASPGPLTVKKVGQQESWGGLYAQYLAPLADIQASKASTGNQPADTIGLRIEQKWPDHAKVGDKIHVRYVVTADRDYEYVALVAPRPATCEPLQQLSGFTHVRGLGYYRAVKDVATEFFFDYLPRGTYVLEEELVVEHPGQYSSGISTIQCLYAPEFSGHTSDVRFRVER